ncbi:UDP-N-acetylmuramoyl-L-alanine--D-glutamate ligase [Candidatus Oleimmundimicrobium sp.]|uniref:UDP-N-acetylmuramoyl-L-alanine--D-glutamate ligase n=1 Tax=Candidatus Oleimmundimicrobium sp. TaxID=3060597 RepID=UPI0027272874|nr:UDP-N-acetylmuramoyl-L-alanine--D-glutamate ligase [Candidatus Oleimmundimicrobium sp.]MDO8885507.1 UDP-N-acetylmuramoyl-L-alanine--D-glutamate ligase [Candidatus Oleimmundimicrobium sp.]
MEFKGKKILVLGMARSGIAAAKKLKSMGAEVLVVDKGDNSSLRKTANILKKEGISVHIGSQPPHILKGQEIIIISPGIPNSISLVEKAMKDGVSIWSEIELAYRLAGPSPFIIGITGTNGKTTTTMLIGEMYKKMFPTVVAGNIGQPLIESIGNTLLNTKFIVELSSFQLENIIKFQPRISVLLNITDDHLDRYTGIDDYAKAKARIFSSQTEEDYAILNYDDPLVWSFAPSIKGKIFPFSKFNQFKVGIFVKSGKIFFKNGKVSKEICAVDELKIKGEHNLDNVMAAAAAALIGGVPLKLVREALLSFKGLEHRVEHVATIKGVDFYNDSKATNPDAVIKALTSFEDRPIILLAGGRNKGNTFRGVAEAAKGKVKTAILFGEAADEIRTAFHASGITTKKSPSLVDAVHAAVDVSEANDVILLSPACASFDMFASYKERGEVFKEAIILQKKENFYGSKKA